MRKSENPACARVCAGKEGYVARQSRHFGGANLLVRLCCNEQRRVEGMRSVCVQKRKGAMFVVVDKGRVSGAAAGGGDCVFSCERACVRQRRQVGGRRRGLSV
jgi:hypothetical protein